MSTKTTSRRKKGSGSIVQVNGKYRAELKFKNPVTDKAQLLRGELRSKKKDAEIDLRNLQDKKEIILSSQNIDVGSITIGDYYKNIFLPYKQDVLKGQTYRRLESMVDTHIVPYFGMRLLIDLSSDEINKRIKDMSKKSSYSSTIKLYDAFNAMYTFAENNGDISPQNNPMGKVSRPREDKFAKKEQQWLKPDEVKKFADAALTMTHDDKLLYKYAHLYLFILNCGIREGEACALLKSDIDFNRKTLQVNKNLNIVKKPANNKQGYIYSVVISTPKNANSVRVVPLNEEAIKHAEKICESFPQGDKLVYSSTGEYVRPDALIKQFQHILNRAGIEKMGLHSLRHTFVSVLFENDIDIHTIASIIGDEVNTVQKTYLHLYKERKARAVNTTNVVQAAYEFDEAVKKRGI